VGRGKGQTPTTSVDKGTGFSILKMLKQSMSLDKNFQRGRGFKPPKTFCGRGYGPFWFQQST